MSGPVLSVEADEGGWMHGQDGKTQVLLQTDHVPRALGSQDTGKILVDAHGRVGGVMGHSQQWKVSIWLPYNHTLSYPAQQCDRDFTFCASLTNSLTGHYSVFQRVMLD